MLRILVGVLAFSPFLIEAALAGGSPPPQQQQQRQQVKQIPNNNAKVLSNDSASLVRGQKLIGQDGGGFKPQR